MGFIVVLIGALGLILFMKNTANAPTGRTAAEAQVATAIGTYLAAALSLPQAAINVLVAQSDLETGHWASSSFLATNSLFNRHKGLGSIGVPNTDGFWTGNVYFASSADPDLRIYTDVNQSAQDMAQLLSESLYASALSALKNGDAPGYYAALQSVGFSADPQYAQNLLDLYQGSYA